MFPPASDIRVKANGVRRRLRLALDTLRMTRPLDSTGENEFLDEVYQQMLGRAPEDAGRRHYLEKLASGYSRVEVVMDLSRSDEFARRAAARLNPLPDITTLRPDRYRREHHLYDGREFVTFVAESTDDYDWLEQCIVDYGFYERPGVWSMDVNLDKRAMAEMISLLGPKSTLEIGCANGAVMSCLSQLGVDVHGVDISASSRNAAPDDIRDKIQLANLEHTQLDLEVDLLYGLDIFEHINPNRVDVFLKSCLAHIRPGGLFFTNTPAFGEDEVFGTAFPPFLASWTPQMEGGLLSHLVTDERGFPENGHLIWATAKWWDAKFRSFGLVREVELEKALHRRYDEYINETSPARRSFFVYSTSPRPSLDDVLRTIDEAPSPVLLEYAQTKGR